MHARHAHPVFPPFRPPTGPRPRARLPARVAGPLLTAVSLLLAWAGTPPPAHAASTASSFWRVTFVDGTVRRLALREGRWAASSRDGERFFRIDAGETTEALPAASVLRLEADDAAQLRSPFATGRASASERSADRLLVLRDGQRWAGTLHADTAGETVVWSHPSLGRLVVPLTRVAGIERRRDGLTAVEASAGPEDRVRLDNGDLVRGVVTGLTPDTLTVETDNGEVTLNWSAVDRLTLAEIDNPGVGNAPQAGRSPDPSLKPATPPPRALDRGRLLLELRDGTVARVDGIDLAGDQCRVRLDGAEAAEPSAARDVAVAEVVCIERVSGWADDDTGAVWPLTLLPPLEVVHTPYFSQRRPPVVDGSAAGRPLQVSGRVVRRGLTLTAYSRCVWPVPPGARTFRFGVRMDPDAPRGAVVVRVMWTDGIAEAPPRPLWQDTVSGDVARWVEIALPEGDARPDRGRLILEADFGASGAVQPWVQLLDPLLRR
ncbi:MAG: hypothetical protein ACK4PI_04845 [Tepidisphaerales bacterium]